MPEALTSREAAEFVRLHTPPDIVAAREAQVAAATAAAAGDATTYELIPGGLPTREQVESMTLIERDTLDAIDPTWQRRFNEREAWAAAQAEGDRERAIRAAEKEHDARVADDPAYATAEYHAIKAKDALTKWSQLTAAQKLEKAGEVNLLPAQRGANDGAGHKLAARVGLRHDQAAELAALQERLVDCPDPRAWGQGVITIAGKHFVLTPPDGFTHAQKRVLRLDGYKQGDPSLS